MKEEHESFLWEATKKGEIYFAYNDVNNFIFRATEDGKGYDGLLYKYKGSTQSYFSPTGDVNYTDDNNIYKIRHATVEEQYLYVKSHNRGELYEYGPADEIKNNLDSMMDMIDKHLEKQQK